MKSLIYIALVWLVSPTFGWTQIELPDLFSDHMVLQRHIPIPIWGNAPAGSELTVFFDQLKLKTKTDSEGNWKVRLPARNAGGPFQLKISSGNESLVFEDILVGEVWVCSGQSNMEWALKKTANGEQEIPKANNPSLRFFHMKKKHAGKATPYSEDQQQAFNNNQYFHSASWEICSPENAAEFSGVAYFFGKTLQDSLGIPVGLIQNAVGGTPIQSWIGEDAMASHPQLDYFVKYPEGGNWFDIENINPWLKQRAKQNLTNWLEKNEDGNLPAHPFAPAYLFENGIKPLAPFAVGGVIWYQGESNATHPDTYYPLFKLMVKNWREVWQQEMPFYFVQLPQIGTRNRWPEFREAQAKCLNIRNTEMVVAIDGGHPTNVHPKEKKGIGNRLAHLALAKTYGQPLSAESPILSTSEWQREDHRVVLYFENVYDGLEVRDEQQPKGIFLQGYFEDGSLEAVISPEKITIEKDKITLVYPADFLPVKVKYAWAPAPENNLVNSAGLPLAPFRVEIGGRD